MASTRLNLRVLTAAMMLATSQSVFAQTATGPPGRLLASNCFQCNGTNGNGPDHETCAQVLGRVQWMDTEETQAEEQVVRCTHGRHTCMRRGSQSA